MIYRESFNIKRGLILIDAIIALSLAAAFIAIITESSIDSRKLFDEAHERTALLDAYEAHAAEFASLMPYQSKSQNGLDARASWFGNDQIQTDIVIATSTSGNANATSSNDHTYSQSLSFSAIRSYPFSNAFDAAGAPLCSADFSKHKPVGSYSYLYDRQNLTKDPLDSQTASTTSIILTLGPAVPLTDIEVRNDIAYISADSNTASDPDLIIADIHDPAHPIIRSSPNTGPGIAAITIAGRRIFGAAASTAAQLHIIKLDSLDSLSLEKKYQLPLPYATATPPFASSIFYDKGKVYLGTEKWDGDEFNIIDVSNPAQPQKIGGLETNSKINDIYVRDGVAYVAAADDKQLRIIDVRDPANPVLVNSFSPSGWQRQEGKAISFFEGALSFGRTSGGFNITTDKEAFAWSTTSASTLNSPASLDEPGGVYGIIADRSQTYLATRQANHELQVLARDLSTSTSISYPLPLSPQAMTCDNDRLYILDHSSPKIIKVGFI